MKLVLNTQGFRYYVNVIVEFTSHLSDGQILTMFSVHCARYVMVTYCYIQGIRRCVVKHLTPQPPWAYYSEIPGDIRVRIRKEGKESIMVLCAGFCCQKSDNWVLTLAQVRVGGGKHSVAYSLFKLQPQPESWWIYDGGCSLLSTKNFTDRWQQISFGSQIRLDQYKPAKLSHLVLKLVLL